MSVAVLAGVEAALLARHREQAHAVTQPDRDDSDTVAHG